MATLNAKCTYFTRLPNPLESNGIKNYYAIVDVDSIFDLSNWRDINVRDPKDSGYVPSQIRQSLLEEETFFLINRGLAISAESVHHDNKSNTLKINVTDKQVHGLLDGGHTYLQLAKFKQTSDERRVEPQFVKVEVITGLDRTKIVNIVDGRNTSNQVKEVSLENLRDKFKELQKVLDNQPYGDKIAYSEYETTTDGSGKTIAKPISIMEILKCLVCLDVEHYNDTKHPVELATNNRVISHFKSHEAQLRALYPLVPSMLQLWDTISEHFVSCYNDQGGKAGKIGGDNNRFFKKRNKPAKLYFLGKTTEWSFADGLKLPIFAAYRAAIKKGRANRYSWKIDDPSKFFVETLGPRVTRVVCQSLIDTQDVTRTVRTDSVWAHCYTETELAVIKSSH